MECTLADEKDSSKVLGEYLICSNCKINNTIKNIVNSIFDYFLQVSPTYVNKFCTTEVMSLYISYFPYILILGPIILVTIEKYFTRTTAGEMKARQFYR